MGRVGQRTERETSSSVCAYDQMQEAALLLGQKENGWLVESELRSATEGRKRENIATVS